MAKTVTRLKKKHRPWMWADKDGALWFWEKSASDHVPPEWSVLTPYGDGWEVDNSREDCAEGGVWTDAPFRRVCRNPFWGKGIEWDDAAGLIDPFYVPQLPTYQQMTGR